MEITGGLGVLANVLEVLSDLVGVHARSWHLNGALPVEVVVAEVVGELLKYCLRQFGVVVGHIEVGGDHAALVGCLWY